MRILMLVVPCFLGFAGATLACSAGDDGPAAAPPAAAKPSDAPAQTEFMRFVRESPSAARLETAIVRYRDGKGREVDLIGAVHIGDAGYFALLNRIFKHYDALLYEMVKPKDLKPTGIGKSDSLVSKFQRALKDLLDLEFQLDGVDYMAPNFVHADLEPKQFFALQKEKGESLLTLIIGAMLNEMKRSHEIDAKSLENPQTQQLALLTALLSKDSAHSMKLVLGQQFGDMEAMAAGMEKGLNGQESVLVGERNKAALAVLKDELAAGKKKLAIYYGAAHMPDMERRLMRDFDMKEFDREWIVAWDIRR